jgi:hypothetical protein
MRTALLSAVVILAATFPAAAQDSAKPNTLTLKEIADGWILLFDGETTFGWSARGASPDGTVKATDGALELGALGDGHIRTATAFDQAELRFEYRCDGPEGELAMQTPARNARIGHPLPAAAAWTACSMKIERDHKVNVNRVAFQVPGIRSYAALFYEPGNILFAQGPKTSLKLRNTKLRPLGMTSMFNGKDLTGWHVFPGKKSEFTVADGTIVCKNGPGDLQTEGKYANFILQLECKSNGKHLNSGVFFRCKANEYQNGYEAQIHNNFTAEPPKDYTVEEYDPESHKLLEKKKVKSAAVDFGTGAIYRRIPARTDVAKDGEWFTMTIVAQGNHIATWVNGIQQVDWYDNRPASDNPRTGCRLEAGHISFQGHDPTTNLSFRNIHIAELPGTSK